MSDPLDRDPYAWSPEDIANVLGRLRDGKIKLVRNDDETKQKLIDAFKQELEKAEQRRRGDVPRDPYSDADDKRLLYEAIRKKMHGAF